MSYRNYRQVILTAGFLAARTYALPIRASMSDLEAFTRSVEAESKIYSDRRVQGTYRKVLEAYTKASSPQQGPTAKDFDKVWDDLKKLRAIKGVAERVMAKRQPMAIAYKVLGKTTFRFERVSRPFHAIWLLEALQDPKSECGPEERLLVDRWTPLLKDTEVFAVEKKGEFTGASVLLVPITNKTQGYLLVSLGNRLSALPKLLFEAFLRDYRKRNPQALPFAIIDKDPKTGASQLRAVDSKGVPARLLGSVENFQLVDKTAKTLRTEVPTRCLPGGAGNVPRAIASVPSPPVIVNNGSAVFAGSSPLGNIPATQNGGNARQGLGTTSSPNGDGSIKLQSNSLGNAVGGTAPSAKAATVPALGGVRPSAPNTAGPSLSSATVANGSQMPAPQLVQLGSPSSPQSAGSASVAPGGPPRFSNDSAGPDGGASPGAQPQASNAPYSGYLSPNDHKLMDAMQRGRDALAQGKPVPTDALDALTRGSLITQNPELKQDAKRTLSEIYYKGDAVKVVQNVEHIDKDNPAGSKEIMADITHDLCRYCTTCSSCVGSKKPE